MRIMLVTFFTLLSIVGCLNAAVYINTSSQLKTELEKITAAESGVTIDLKLNSSVTVYTLKTTTDFTLLHNVAFIMGSDQPIEIICTGTSSPGTGIRSDGLGTGIAFVNSSVSLYNLTFIRCGGYLNTLPDNVTDVFNSTSYKLHYSPHYASALLFVECTVSMSHVIMQSSFGFAVIGYNLNSSNFMFFKIRKSTTKYSEEKLRRGCGMLLHFTDSTNRTTDIWISLNNTQFSENAEYVNGTGCISEKYYHMYQKHVIHNAAGLSLIYTQSRYQVYTDISSTAVSRNSGIYAGGVLILYLNSSRLKSATTFTNTRFSDNTYNSKELCHGESLQVFWIMVKQKGLTESVMANNVVFYDTIYRPVAAKQVRKQSSAVYVEVDLSDIELHITFKNTFFFGIYNPAAAGAGLKAYLRRGTSNLTITMESVQVKNMKIQHPYSTPKSIFFFKELHQVIFEGEGIFENNFGSAIHVEDTDLILKGKMLFRNNIGIKGGAIRVEGNGHLYFTKGVHVKFVNNLAYIAGGAIFADGGLYSACAVQIATETNVSFTNNTSKAAGKSIFTFPVYHCTNHKEYKFSWIPFYEKTFNLHEHPNQIREVSTHPFKSFVYYKPVYRNWFNVDKPTVFPGETFNLSMSAYDYSYNNVFTFFGMNVFCIGGGENAKVWLKNSGGNEIIEGLQSTNANFSIHINSPNIHYVVLVFTIQKLQSKTIKFKLLRCLLGFSLNLDLGSCDCNPIFRKQSIAAKCLINHKTIELQDRKNIWVGTVLNNSNTAISTSCPLTYCNTDPYYKYIKSSEDYHKLMLSHNGTDMVPYCLHNRDGVLCGQCKKGYCLTFGLDKCKKCSTKWFEYVYIFIGTFIIGIVLIVVLYSLKLTLTTGTINGMIFYAQAANAGLVNRLSITYLDQSNGIGIVHEICRAFLNFINLNFGVSIQSFQAGFNQLWKTGLSLLFPVYLLVIVIIIIIISRYSTWLSNKTSHSSIQVLVTVVHLSFSKLLLALIAVFTPAEVHTLDYSYKVWYWDGSVKYMKYPHILLVVITTVIVSTFLIMYMVPLLFGKYLIRKSRFASFYLRPFLEAILAPYKDNRQVWFAARLVLVIFMYLIYVIFRAQNDAIMNVTISSILSLFLIGQALFQPFKNKLINILDCWLMFNITIVYVTLWSNIQSIANIVNVVTVVLAIVTFILILLYHLVIATCVGCFKKTVTRIQQLREKKNGEDQKPLVARQAEDEEFDEEHFYRDPLNF